MPKTGRPTRAQASAKALANVDLSKVDPLQILRQIAADISAPAAARVVAAKALLAHSGKQKGGDDGSDLDRIQTHALRLLRGGRK